LLGISPLYLQAAGFAVAALILGLIFRSRRLFAFELILVLVVVVAGGYFFGYRMPLLGMMKQGLDLKGGTYLVLEAVATAETPVTPERLHATVEVIRERIDRLGVTEPVIYEVPQKNRIVVELAGQTREEAMRDVQVGYLYFRDAEGNTIITGDDLIQAQEQLDSSGAAFVKLDLKTEAKKRFADATTRIYGGQSASRQIFIYLDQELQSAPTVEAPNIEDPIIQGYEDLKDAKRIATILNVGALPLQLNVAEVREVSASLGAESLRLSEVAALIGIGGVILFMLLFYRVAGIIANFALFVYGILVIAALVGLGATLTLPGVAGLVLGVGMAVDANVLIYERVKDHLRMGRTLRAALDTGFRSAIWTIVDANVTTLFAAIVLFFYGTGPIRGFAVTLGASIVISMLTAVVFSQYVLRVVINSGIVRRASTLFGEKEANLGGAR
jgi:preprotein translocase subunit SecD